MFMNNKNSNVNVTGSFETNSKVKKHQYLEEITGSKKISITSKIKRKISTSSRLVVAFDIWVIRRKWNNMPGLIAMMLLLLAFFIFEFYVSTRTASVVVLADSYQILTEFNAVLIGVLARRYKYVYSTKNTFGWSRIEIMGVTVNGIFLLGLCFKVCVAAIQNLFVLELDKTNVKDPEWIIQMAVASFIIKLISLFLFYEKGAITVTRDSLCGESTPLLGRSSIRKNQNENKSKREQSSFSLRSMIFHIIGGFASSIFTLITGLIVYLVNNHKTVKILDPTLALILVIVLVITEVTLIKDAALILLQTVPSHIRPLALQRKLIENVEGVLAVHEFHVWQLSGSKFVCSMHIQCDDLKNYNRIAEEVKKFFHEEGIHSTTVQPEFDEITDEERSRRPSTPLEPECILECGPEKDCFVDTCCAPRSPKALDRVKKRHNATKTNGPIDGIPFAPTSQTAITLIDDDNDSENDELAYQKNDDKSYNSYSNLRFNFLNPEKDAK